MTSISPPFQAAPTAISSKSHCSRCAPTLSISVARTSCTRITPLYRCCTGLGPTQRMSTERADGGGSVGWVGNGARVDASRVKIVMPAAAVERLAVT